MRIVRRNAQFPVSLCAEGILKVFAIIYLAMVPRMALNLNFRPKTVRATRTRRSMTLPRERSR